MLGCVLISYSSTHTHYEELDEHANKGGIVLTQRRRNQKVEVTVFF